MGGGLRLFSSFCEKKSYPPMPINMDSPLSRSGIKPPDHVLHPEALQRHMQLAYLQGEVFRELRIAQDIFTDLAQIRDRSFFTGRGWPEILRGDHFFGKSPMGGPLIFAAKIFEKASESHFSKRFRQK